MWGPEAKGGRTARLCSGNNPQMQLMDMFLLQRMVKIHRPGVKWHIGLCAYSSVSCWLYLCAQNSGMVSRAIYFAIGTHHNHVHGTRKLWILACDRSKTHPGSHVSIWQISSYQQSLHCKRNVHIGTSKIKASKAAAGIWDLLCFLTSGHLMRAAH